MTAVGNVLSGKDTIDLLNPLKVAYPCEFISSDYKSSQIFKFG